MCGIVGIVRPKATSVSVDLCQAFEQMWWGTQLRGMNGSGLFQASKGRNKIVLEKSAFTPDYAIYEKPISVMTRNVDIMPFTFAHCRQATKLPAKADDKYLKKNAHPFQYKHITLMHNGYFSYVGKDHNDAHEVDSAAFTHAVADLGIDDALEKAYGSYALVYYDSDEETLNIARNSDRPLWKLEHYFGHIFISEPELALWVLKRLKLAPPTSIAPVPVDRLFSYKEGIEFADREIKKRVYTHPTTHLGWTNRAPIHGRSREAESRTQGDVSLTEALIKAARFCWDDATWIAKYRKMPVGWSPVIGEDYAEFLRSTQGIDESDDDDVVTVVSSPPKYIYVEKKDSIISRIFNTEHGFNLVKGRDYTFSVDEIHEHKGFCSIIGRVPHEIAKKSVKIIGNFNKTAAEIKDSRQLLTATVLSIAATKNKGKPEYLVNVGNIGFSAIIDINKYRIDKPLAPRAALLLENKGMTEELNFDSLITCPGCNTIVAKEAMKEVQHTLFTDPSGNATTKITLTICPSCQEKASEDFDSYYQKEYRMNILERNH